MNKRRGILVFFLCLLNSVAVGCSKSSGASSDVDFACESDPTPSRVGLNTFTITLTGRNGERLAGGHIFMEGYMSHPGMSPTFANANEISPGRYRGQLELNMRGDWTALFPITLPGGHDFDRQMDIRSLQAT